MNKKEQQLAVQFFRLAFYVYTVEHEFGNFNREGMKILEQLILHHPKRLSFKTLEATTGCSKTRFQKQGLRDAQWYLHEVATYFRGWIKKEEIKIIGNEIELKLEGSVPNYATPDLLNLLEHLSSEGGGEKSDEEN